METPHALLINPYPRIEVSATLETANSEGKSTEGGETAKRGEVANVSDLIKI